MFAAFTPALVLGAAAERGRILPILVFVFVWATLVYDPIASWTWNSSGWAAEMGVLDFAGGTVVHITSGAAALAYSLMLGPRKQKLLQVHLHPLFFLKCIDSCSLTIRRTSQ